MFGAKSNKRFGVIKKSFTIVLIILGAQANTCAQESTEPFTIFLVRHAEKDLSSGSPSDPPLTTCGEKRSESLSRFFSAVDLDVIYSTDYIRTKSTALPTATTKGLGIEIYDPDKLKEFSDSLLEKKQDALVVGHSNTTAVLAGLLVGKELGEFDLNIYNRVYQVVVYKDNDQLHLLHTAFQCKD